MLRKILLRRLPESLLFGLALAAGIFAGRDAGAPDPLLAILIFVLGSAVYLAVRSFLEWLALR